MSAYDAALRRLVRQGELTGEQHAKLDWLLFVAASAVDSVAEVDTLAQGHPQRDALWRESYKAVAWERVGEAYAELLAVVSGGPEVPR